jgi:glycine/D-amino acid oxidase-like deaminating enzyme
MAGRPRPDAVVVVGDGLIGSSIAYQLARTGVRTHVSPGVQAAGKPAGSIVDFRGRRRHS